VNFIYKTFLLLTIVLSVSFSVSANTIEKGFKALEEYNYFEAKKIFLKTIKKDSSASGFGLATIFFRNDNPFHSLDSAYRYICISERYFISVSDKEKEFLRKYKFEYLNIIELRAKISHEYFNIALKENSILGYDKFIKNNDWSNDRFQAIHKRDSLAFEGAQKINTSSALSEFINNYTTSEYIIDAQKVLELCQYRETTETGTIDSYILFCVNYPINKYVKDAEDRIFELSIPNKSLQEYSDFIKLFPQNRNIEVSWRNIYQLFMIDYADNKIQLFQSRYPNYPFMAELEQDIKYAKRQLVPFKNNGLFGFMDFEGNQIIEPIYEYLGFYNEGLAVAVKNGKYGYIDKGNNVIIDFIYESGSDFEDGRSIVGLNGKVGVINRAGHTIIPIDFIDLGNFSEGLIYAKRDSLYGYYDNTGFQRIEEKFTEAFSFNKGLAKVQNGKKQSFIDIYGTAIVPPIYESIQFYSDSLLIFELNGKYGICRKNGLILDSAKYDVIGVLSNNRSLVAKNGKIGYLNGEGKVVLDLKFDEFPNFIEIGQFNGVYAVVRYKGKYGVIDNLGKLIIPANYNQLSKFSPLMAYTKGKGWGFIDLTNASVITPQFDFAESFQDGYAIVEKSSLIGLINPQGILTIPIIFNDINHIDKNLVTVTLDKNQGVYNVKGEVIVPPEYQQIRLLNKDFLILTKADEVHYLYLPQNRILKPKIGDE
jgi:hypothetical protein